MCPGKKCRRAVDAAGDEMMLVLVLGSELAHYKAFGYLAQRVLPDVIELNYTYTHTKYYLRAVTV